MVESPDFHDPAHGIPVFSLYGEVRRPTAAMLDTFDVLLVDLQDLGCRIYTFITTLRYVLEAARAHGKSVWVLDRPNPIGRPVEGLTLRAGWESFVGAGAMPMRHGLTLGEMGHWFVRTVAARRRVPRRRDAGLAARGGAPATAGRSASAPGSTRARTRRTCGWRAAIPGTVMLEGTTLSEGRGTTRPLELFGAPDLDVARDRRRDAATRAALAARLPAAAVLVRAHVPQARGRAVRGPAGARRGRRPTTTTRSGRGGCRRSRSRRCAACTAITICGATFPYEYEHERLAIDLINGSELLRRWVDDADGVLRRPRGTGKYGRARMARTRRRAASTAERRSDGPTTTCWSSAAASTASASRAMPPVAACAPARASSTTSPRTPPPRAPS